MNTDDYKSETVLLEFLSSATLEECQALIGKTIAAVEAREYTFVIKFTDGSYVEFNGSTYGGCSLNVNYSKES